MASLPKIFAKIVLLLRLHVVIGDIVGESYRS